MKFTQNTLDKVEKIIEDCGYIIRYERGTFQSGYCILQEKKVVVLNKILQTTKVLTHKMLLNLLLKLLLAWTGPNPG